MFRTRLVPYGRVRAIQAVALVFAVSVLLVYILRLSGSRRHGIYRYTEGQTKPWREWDGKKLPPAAAPPIDEASYLRHLVREHGLTPEVAWHSRRIRPTYRGGLGGSAAGGAGSTGRYSPPPSMTEVSGSFMPHGFSRRRVAADDEQPSPSRLRPNKGGDDDRPIALRLARSPTPDSVDASSLLFGISTTYSRASYANSSILRDWQRWLTDGRRNSNGAKLVLVLEGASRDEVVRVDDCLRELGVDGDVLASSPSSTRLGVPSSPASRHAELLGLLNRRNSDYDKGGSNGGGDGDGGRDRDGEPVQAGGAYGRRKDSGKGGRNKKRMVAVVDDDVFFPSMASLVRRLGQFSLGEEFYIGVPSDKQSDWIVVDGDDGGRGAAMMTYGGGAVFLTPPMAEKAARLPCMKLDEPKQAGARVSSGGASHGAFPSASGVQWDEHFYRCIAAHTSHSLHILPSLYSPEEDALYEQEVSSEGYGGGQQALSLHHYKNWHKFEAGTGHRVASACGEGCFLQRFHFQQDGWVLVNGCMLMHYPDGMDVVPRAMRRKKKTKAGEEEEQEDEEEDEVLVESRRKNTKPKTKTSSSPPDSAGKKSGLPPLKADEEGGPKKQTDRNGRPRLKTGGNGREQDGRGGDPGRKTSPPAPARPPPGRSRPLPPAGGLVIDDSERPDPADAKVVRWRGRRRTWRLLDSRAVAETGEVWQAYVKRRGAAGRDGGEPDGGLPGDTVHTSDEPAAEDSVVVLVWEPEAMA